MSPFCGATDDHVLVIFWWNPLWDSKPEWAARFTLGRIVHVIHSMRFTSGPTPANLLSASIAADPIPSTYLPRHCWDSVFSWVNFIYTGFVGYCFLVFNFRITISKLYRRSLVQEHPSILRGRFEEISVQGKVMEQKSEEIQITKMLFSWCSTDIGNQIIHHLQ